MPDICMCKGLKCPRKKTCYRHTAPPTPHWQSYFVTPPFKEDGSCEHYCSNAFKTKSISKQRIQGVGNVWPCRCDSETFPVWGSGFLHCPKCDRETGMNDSNGTSVREWNKAMKPVVEDY